MNIRITTALLIIAAPAVHAQQIDWDADWDKQTYVRAMTEAAKKDRHWNPTRESLEARFDELDTDSDGVLTKTERDAGKKKKR